MPLIFFSFSAFGLEDKVNCDSLLLDFLSKFIDMYRMDTVISLILLLVSEMLKIPWAIVEVHFFKKLAFPTNKFLAQMFSENVQGQEKIFQNAQQYANSYPSK